MVIRLLNLLLVLVVLVFPLMEGVQITWALWSEFLHATLILGAEEERNVL